MTPRYSLPGLDRLLAACAKYPVVSKTREPWKGAPASGAMILGRPVDPMLAAFYCRLGGLHLDSRLFIEPCDKQMNGLLRANEEIQSDWPEPFRSLLLFGSVEAMLYTFATVPRLADAQGLQPVVRVNSYEDIYALPIASNVDLFFDIHARYLELIYENPDFRDDPDFRPVFPWDVPELIATDRALMAMIVEGHFDFLMFNPAKTSAKTHQDIRKWIAQLQAVRP